MTKSILLENIAAKYDLVTTPGEITEPILFEIDGRQGYIRIQEEYVIEASASASTFDQHDVSLEQIALSLTFVRPEWDKVYED